MEQVNSMEFVDLGLPSGLKWAKCNIGATSETDYGNYYMWGSTEPNTADECNWANTPFNNGSDRFEKKYFNAHKSEWLDDKNNLKPEYDVAYKATNGMARIPTRAEIQELLDNTDNEWIEDFNGSGVNGRKFTSKTDTSKYIFIPAEGYCYNGSVGNIGISGAVWSSSLDTSYNGNAWNLYFFLDYYYLDYGNRCRGRSIRPVTD